MTSTQGQPLDDYLPQPGTDLYYAHLYAPASLRPTLALIEALRGEIARVPLRPGFTLFGEFALSHSGLHAQTHHAPTLGQHARKPKFQAQDND
jgi:hypothetical protein